MSHAREFIDYIGGHYPEIQRMLLAYCRNRGEEFSDDILHQTFLNCYETIDRKGEMSDPTPKGFRDYLFKAFKFNIMREKQYARNKNRASVEDFVTAWESFLESCPSADEKVQDDMRKDFGAWYIATRAEEAATEGAIDIESFHLWRIKTFMGFTYQQLGEVTGAERVREKVLSVKHWLQENISRQDITDAFNERYGLGG
jgi:hypothetical protein